MGRPLSGITAEVADPSDELAGAIQNRVKRELAASTLARSSSSRSYRKRSREDPTNELRERTG